MFEDLRVRDWMTNPVYSLPPNTPISTAHKIMKDRGVRRLPVLHDGRLVGIITLGDIREASPSDATTLSIWELNHLWSQLTVERVMTASVHTIGPDAPLLDAAALMFRHKISGLPVMEGDRLVGMVTESDIFRMLITQRRRTPAPAASDQAV